MRWKILVANFSFKNQNEESSFAFGAAMAGYKRSFIRLLNVLSQLYTFSCLYLLEKKCTRLKNCRLVLCSMFKTINDLYFHDLSRRSTDRHVVRTRPQLCSISCSKNMAAKLRTAQTVKRCKEIFNNRKIGFIFQK